MNQCPFLWQWKHSSSGEGPDLPFCLRLRARGLIGNLFLAFVLARRPTLPLYLFLLNHHQMIVVLLNAILGCFKHSMQLSHGLLYAIHMKVHNELLIAHREQLENHVSSQVILELATKLSQGLNVTHHLDHMRIDRPTLCQLICKQDF
jgi:hypothetical protein